MVKCECENAVFEEVKEILKKNNHTSIVLSRAKFCMLRNTQGFFVTKRSKEVYGSYNEKDLIWLQRKIDRHAPGTTNAMITDMIGILREAEDSYRIVSFESREVGKAGENHYKLAKDNIVDTVCLN